MQFLAPSIRTREAQLPPAGSDDARIARQLVEMSPTEFEGAVVSLFRELKDVPHTITRTQPSKDGAFDFFGEFFLPHPVGYKIDFLRGGKTIPSQYCGRSKTRVAIGGATGSGTDGLFVTTSYFSKQTQEEVQADAYPAWLIAGADVVSMMRQLRIAHGPSISPTWLEAVAAEIREGLFNRN